ncbi:MAG: hypothetical protein R3F17_07230 [Planctomycetota bacterium]
MLFHMLRIQHGDGTFVKALQRVYDEWIGRRVGFDDLQSAFERQAGSHMDEWFSQY